MSSFGSQFATPSLSRDGSIELRMVMAEGKQHLKFRPDLPGPSSSTSSSTSISILESRLWPAASVPDRPALKSNSAFVNPAIATSLLPPFFAAVICWLWSFVSPVFRSGRHATPGVLRRDLFGPTFETCCYSFTKTKRQNAPHPRGSLCRVRPTLSSASESQDSPSHRNPLVQRRRRLHVRQPAPLRTHAELRERGGECYGLIAELWVVRRARWLWSAEGDTPVDGIAQSCSAKRRARWRATPGCWAWHMRGSWAAADEGLRLKVVDVPKVKGTWVRGRAG
ncbi:hypothetical protein B0H19DRAFT_379368 [Mycena capillaripes]|nr:hypothetical protein B0H19DRAFT_379368 [Mycena capillaripes]